MSWSLWWRFSSSLLLLLFVFEECWKGLDRSREILNGKVSVDDRDLLEFNNVGEIEDVKTKVQDINNTFLVKF